MHALHHLAVGLCTALAMTVLSSGCATPRDHNIDVDALLRELDLDQSGATTAYSSTSAFRSPVSQVASPSAVVPAASPLPVRDVPPGIRSSGSSVDAPLAPPPDAASMPGGELTIQPDCLVQIGIEEDPALNGTYPVNDIGAVTLGYVGPVILYNKTEPQAAEKIRDILTSRHFRNATVQVRIIRASYDKVKVSGEVVSPGSIKIGAGDSISLNDALLRVGGLTPNAVGAKVKIVRDGLLSAVALAAQGEVYDLTDPQGQPYVPRITIDNNDVVHVFVPVAGAGTPMAVDGGRRSVLVLGEVSRPGVYHFDGREPCTMMHLMFRLAGQLSPFAKDTAVRIVRTGPDGQTETLEVDAQKILRTGDPSLDVLLQDGDRVIVPQRRVSIF